MTAASRVERVALALVHSTCEQYGDPFPTNPDLSLTSILARAAIAAYAAALAEDGLAIVPRQPTAEMQEAAAKLLSCPRCDGFGADVHQCDIWRAMFDAAKP